MTSHKINHTFYFCRLFAVLMSAVMIFAATACQDNVEDDKTMTDSLIENYMDALCKFDIAEINKNSLGNINEYSDSSGVKSACKLIAGSIKWEITNININGSTAIAQIKIYMPSDIGDICQSALNDAMLQTENGSDSTPDELLRSAVKSRLADTEMEVINSEVSMSKIGNKWYISKSPDTAAIISDIRTPVAAVYSILEQ